MWCYEDEGTDKHMYGNLRCILELSRMEPLPYVEPLETKNYATGQGYWQPFLAPDYLLFTGFVIILKSYDYVIVTVLGLFLSLSSSSSSSRHHHHHHHAINIIILVLEFVLVLVVALVLEFVLDVVLNVCLYPLVMFLSVFCLLILFNVANKSPTCLSRSAQRNQSLWNVYSMVGYDNLRVRVDRRLISSVTCGKVEG